MQLDHVVLVDERHLEVELGELGLAVGARVLVAEAARDLVVALEPADHQQLLEQLRRLRQRVERARLDPRRARGSRARPRASSGSGTASRSRGSRARSSTSRIVAIDAVAQRDRVAASARGAGRARGGAAAASRRPFDVLVERERRRVRVGEDLELGDGELDLAGREVRVDVLRLAPRSTVPAALITSSERSLCAAACASGALLGVEHELHDPRAVAQVDEDQPAVVAAAVHPAGDARLGAGAVGGRARRTRVAVAVRARRRASRRPAPPAGSSGSHRSSVERRAARRTAMSLSVATPFSPTIATYRAPSRSACLSWPLSERPASSSCACEPRAARLAGQLERRAALHRCRCAPARRTGRPSSGARRCSPRGEQHPLDPGRPADAGRRRAAELLDQAVVAAAAADARLRAERVAGELEHRARVVVEPAHERRVELVARRRRRRAARARCAKCSASSGSSAVEQLRRVRASPRCVPGSPESNARSGLRSIRLRTSSRRAGPRGRAGRPAAPRGTRRASPASRGSTSRSRVPLDADARRSSVGQQHDQLGVDLRRRPAPIASAPTCQNWR